MIDQLSTLLTAAMFLKREAPQEIFEIIDVDERAIDFGEGVQDLKSQALFMHYLMQQHSPLVASTGDGVKSQLPAQSLPSLPRISEGIVVTVEGQKLPSSGNRFPSVDSVAVDPKLFSMPASRSGEAHPAKEPTILPFTAVNRASGIVQAPDLLVDLKLGSTRVEQPLSNRVLWMVSQNVQVAELRVNPPQLGPVEVRISVEGDQTNVSLIAQHSLVREVMESAIPRLRDMLAESGLNLNNIDVSQQDLSQRKDEALRYLPLKQEDLDSTENQSAANNELDKPHRSVSGLGLVDYYV